MSPQENQPRSLRQTTIKNRNHNTGQNLTGMVPLHGLINANFTAISKNSDTKSSF